MGKNKKVTDSPDQGREGVNNSAKVGQRLDESADSGTDERTSKKPNEMSRNDDRKGRR